MIKIKLHFTHLLMLITIALLTGCGEGSKADIKEASSTPEFAAQRFFYAIYQDGDMELVQKYSTPKMQRIVKGYGSISGIKRNMLNMQFDTLEIEIEKTGNLRESYGDNATLTLIFNGTYNGSRTADMRVVKLVKRKGDWLVEKVKDDPYAR